MELIKPADKDRRVTYNNYTLPNFMPEHGNPGLSTSGNTIKTYTESGKTIFTIERLLEA